jgi:hypothetical protein
MAAMLVALLLFPRVVVPVVFAPLWEAVIRWLHGLAG